MPSYRRKLCRERLFYEQFGFVSGSMGEGRHPDDLIHPSIRYLAKLASFGIF